MDLRATGLGGVLLAVGALGCGGSSAREAAKPAAKEAPATPVAAPTTAAAAGRAPLEVATSAPGESGAPLRFSCGGELVDNPGGPLHCLYKEPTTWHEAEGRCVERGGHLAAIASVTDGDFLRRTFGWPAGVEAFWIGLVEPREGRWLWPNGTPDKLALWGPGEPNDDGSGENCGTWRTPTALWNDVDCDFPQAYLCEGAMSVPGKGRGLRCEGGSAFQFDGRAYCLNRSEQTWDLAQKACVADGGSLAAIESARENEALAQRFKPPVAAPERLWIGLTDGAEEGRFRWTTGDRVAIEQWRAGEPNNQSDEDCVEWFTSDGQWNDLPCSERRASICQETKAAMALRLGGGDGR